jgi:protein gp37
MPGKTSIEWTDRTSNPVRARRKDNGKVGWHCNKCSSGCAFCYAEPINLRFGTGLPFNAHSDDLVEIFLHRPELEAVVKLRTPSKIFHCDMTDLFLADVPDPVLDRFFAMVAVAGQHVHQVLTKRIDRALAYLTDPATRVRIANAVERDWLKLSPCLGHLIDDVCDGDHWPLPNLWLGTSVENRAAADARIPLLAQIPAAVRFLSVEPLLGPVTLDLAGIHWAIVGGESGPHARPCNVAWIRSIVRQCREAGVACFVKQWGSRPYFGGHRGDVYDDHTYHKLVDSKGGDPAEWPEDIRVREFPQPMEVSR